MLERMTEGSAATRDHALRGGFGGRSPSDQTPEVSRTELTPLLFLERSERVFPDRTAVVYGEQRTTYGDLGRRSRQLATALMKAGLKRNERVAFLCPNTPPLLEAHFGVALAGGVLVAINTRLNGDEIQYILNHSGARYFFVDAELAPVVEPVADRFDVEKVITIEDAEFAPGIRRVFEGLTYEEFINVSPDPSLVYRVPDETDLISINYTSGTTGRPKGVMYTHRGAYLNALSEIIAHKVETTSKFLWIVPMFHCNGWCFTWGVTGAGGTHVCLRRVEPPLVWQLVREEGVTHFNGAPTVLIMLINDPNAPTGRIEQTIRIATGGAPPSPTLLGQWEAIGAVITHLYGLTETYGPHTYCEWNPNWDGESPERRALLRARQGVASVVACELRVVDEDMNDAPADAETMGEVVMRGNNVMAGYFEQPEATAEAFRGGWFHSGDVAVMHPDGYIELRDRKKDIIISGGENISTIEVEQAVAAHPSVLEVAVIAVPDEKWGEVPKAFVVLKDGQSATESDIIEHCRALIARFKCPKSVEFGELPKTSTGKVQKFVLRDKEWAGQEKRIN